MAIEGGAGGRGVRVGRTIGDVREEELDDTIDLEIEKVRRTAYHTEFSTGSLCSMGSLQFLMRCCWTPRKWLRGNDQPWQRRPRSVSRTLELLTVPYHTVSLRRDRTWLRIFSDRESSPG